MVNRKSLRAPAPSALLCFLLSPLTEQGNSAGGNLRTRARTTGFSLNLAYLSWSPALPGSGQCSLLREGCHACTFSSSCRLHPSSRLSSKLGVRLTPNWDKTEQLGNALPFPSTSVPSSPMCLHSIEAVAFFRWQPIVWFFSPHLLYFPQPAATKLTPLTKALTDKHSCYKLLNLSHGLRVFHYCPLVIVTHLLKLFLPSYLAGPRAPPRPLITRSLWPSQHVPEAQLRAWWCLVLCGAAESVASAGQSHVSLFKVFSVLDI